MVVGSRLSEGGVRGTALCRLGATSLVFALVFAAACRGKRAEPPRRAAAKNSRGEVKGQRPARLAGRWYPADPASLGASLERWLEAARRDEPTNEPAGPLLAVVAPHAAYRYSGRVAAAAYRLLRRAKPSRVFVLGANHVRRLRGIALPRGELRLQTPLGSLQIDQGALQALRGDPLFVSAPAALKREHSIELQLPFLAHVAPAARIVPLVVGALTWNERRRAAHTLRGLLRPGDVLVASSDFTHRGPNYRYRPFASGGDVRRRLQALDLQAFGQLERTDLAAWVRFKHRTGVTICGFEALSLLREVLGRGARGTLLRYDTSLRLEPDATSSVSYLAIAFHGSSSSAVDTADPWTRLRQLSPRPERVLTRALGRRALILARRALEAHLSGRPMAPLGDVGGALSQRHRVFVTLRERHGGRLRGCRGKIKGRLTLARGIVAAAIDAAKDRRFGQLAAHELVGLRIEVTVVGEPRAIPGPEAITLGRDGVILRAGAKRALLLPQIPVEHGWGLVATLRALALKAGLKADGWRDARFETFRGELHREP